MEAKEKMKPQVGDKYVNIPVTLDGSVGRNGRYKGKLLVVVIVTILTGFLMFSQLTTGDGGLVKRVLMAFLILFVSSSIVRFMIMGELKLRKTYKKIIKNDHQFDIQTLWGIYKPCAAYPYIYYMSNGGLVSYIRMGKDVIIGRKEQDLFNHYDKIADALRFAGENGLTISHIDYMDSVGKDERIDIWMEEAMKTSNPDFKDAYSMMYSHMTNSVLYHMSSEDVYAVYGWMPEQEFNRKIKEFAKELRKANYASFSLLDRVGIQNLISTVYGFKTFSFYEASKSTFKDNSKGGRVVPILLKTAEGFEKINKTKKEIKEESEKAKQSRKNKNKGKNQGSGIVSLDDVL